MTEPHHRSSIILSTILPTLLVVIGVGGLYAMYRGRTIAGVDRPPEATPVVETVSVLPHSGGIDLTVDGVVAPYREIELSAEVAGRIVKKSPACRAGNFVTKGSLLLEIDPRDYVLELRRLNEQLKQADININECDVETDNIEKLIALAEEEHELQKTELARMQRLVGNDSVSESDFDKAKKSEWTSRNNKLTLRNQLLLIANRRRGLITAKGLVQTQIDRAELDLQRTKIVSPVDGVVVRDAVEQDSFVQKGTLVALVEDTTKVEVRCSLKMDDLVWLWRQTSPSFAKPKSSSVEELSPVPRPAGDNPSAGPGNSAIVQPANEDVTTVDGLADWGPHYEIPRTPATVMFRMHDGTARYMWRGTLTRFDGSGIDERTRTVPCRIVVDEPRSIVVEGSSDATGPRALVRGMYVSVALHAKPQTEFIRVPESAIQPGKNVLRVRDGKLDIVGPLTLVRLIDEGLHRSGNPQKYWIAHAQDTDLKVSDKVVVSPLPSAYSGMSVREQESP